MEMWSHAGTCLVHTGGSWQTRERPGVDKMTVDELKLYLQEHWARIKQELISGEYRPQAVRVVEIPKLAGGMRQMGIPTVVDRLILQAVHQVLSPHFEGGFSESYTDSGPEEVHSRPL
jgi:retron-type reverse transcriptase